MARQADIKVILLRSGRTEWDEEGRLQGRTDLPLSPSGLDGSREAVREVISPPSGLEPGVVFTAPDEASQTTARLLAEASEAKLRTDEGLQSMDLGLWEGLLESDIRARFPSAARLWIDQPSAVQPPEGEPFEDADHRIRLAICRLMDKANGKPVAFVLRPLPYAMATCWLTGRPASEVWSIINDGPAMRRVALSRDRVREMLDELKAQA